MSFIGATAMPAPPRLTSEQHEDTLNIIDAVRRQGVGRYIDIPQIVTIGDQSSGREISRDDLFTQLTRMIGKSSVHEAICNVRFETGDGTCTRYATEYCLRRNETSSTSISIEPDAERSIDDKLKLLAWTPSVNDLSKFPTIQKEAANAMGIGPSKTFSQDRLVVRLSGPTQPHLTLVDVPGLVQYSGSKESDIDLVYSLSESYSKNPRSIIMAVISANNDKENQIVLKMVAKHDPEGRRTIGVITKPDTLSQDSPKERRFVKLAQNQDPETKFNLGWAVLRNRSYEERDTSPTQRDRTEEAFVESGIWNTLAPSTKGVRALRKRLGQVLHDHILAELPNMLKEIDAAVSDCEHGLELLGSSRSTVQEQRLYLLRASQRYFTLMSNANGGQYLDKYFNSATPAINRQKKIRAVAMGIMTRFTDNMRLNGHAVQPVDSLPQNYKHIPGTPRMIQKDVYYEEVIKLMNENRGRELKGLMQPDIVRILFHDQIQPWRGLADAATSELLQASYSSIRLVLEFAADDATATRIQREIVGPAMETMERGVYDKVEEILELHFSDHPQCFDHSVIDKIQIARRNENAKTVEARLKAFLKVDPASSDKNARIYTGSFDASQLLNILSGSPTEVNVDRFAAIDAVTAMLAYYHHAYKLFDESFGLQVMNQCLLNKLQHIFKPEVVTALDDATITRLAGESEESIEQRASLNKKLSALKEAQRVARLMSRHKPQESLSPPSTKDVHVAGDAQIKGTTPTDSTPDSDSGPETPGDASSETAALEQLSLISRTEQAKSPSKVSAADDVAKVNPPPKTQAQTPFKFPNPVTSQTSTATSQPNLFSSGAPFSTTNRSPSPSFSFGKVDDKPLAVPATSSFGNNFTASGFGTNSPASGFGTKSTAPLFSSNTSSFGPPRSPAGGNPR